MELAYCKISLFLKSLYFKISFAKAMYFLDHNPFKETLLKFSKSFKIRHELLQA